MKLKNIALAYPWEHSPVTGRKSVLRKIFKSSTIKLTAPDFLLSFINRINGNSSNVDDKRTGINVGSRQRFKLPVKKVLGFFLALLFVVGFIKIIQNLSQTTTSSANLDVKPAIATLEVNKELSFPLKGEDGETLADIKYLVEKAELTDEIIVKGQKASAIKGRLFLILTLKISNDFKSPIEMITKDYIRLSVNGNEEEWLAPDIHNDPVEVQAISIKYTRVGFAVNEDDKNLVLRVGQIEGEKEKIPLNF